jgi:hypothetical protein
MWKSMRTLKLIIAVILLPACVGATSAAWQAGRIVLGGGNLAPAIALGAGYLLWLLVFIFLPTPVRTYVLGHELTHAVWALLMGARVSGLSVRKAGGQVRTSKNNWAITLAPYFFPFYAMLFMAVFFSAHAIWDLTAQLWILFFLIGLGWSFHVTFTIMVLFTVSQPDVKSQGVLFSAVVIYLMNLLVMAMTAALLSQSLTFVKLAQVFGDSLPASYVWTLDKFGALWEYAHVAWSQR